MAAGYILAYVNMADPVQYEQYKMLSTKAMQAHGAEPLMRGGKTEPLEDEWNPTHAVVPKFLSYDTAKTFCNSEKYRAVRSARAKAANVNVIVIEGT